MNPEQTTQYLTDIHQIATDIHTIATAILADIAGIADHVQADEWPTPPAAATPQPSPVAGADPSPMATPDTSTYTPTLTPGMNPVQADLATGRITPDQQPETD